MVKSLSATAYDCVLTKVPSLAGGADGFVLANVVSRVDIAGDRPLLP